MTGVYFDAGCERHAYAPIVGSGPNSAILHYSRNSRRMDRGRTAADGRRRGVLPATPPILPGPIPVRCKFTKRQREIYEIVLGAQKAVIAAIKPGVSDPGELSKTAREYIDSHGKDLHGEPLGKYFTHGVSHQWGSTCMTPRISASRLAEGNVITVEPGIYIPEENIGIRIEDMVLVTKDGAKADERRAAPRSRRNRKGARQVSDAAAQPAKRDLLGVAGGVFVLAVAASWTSFGAQIDNDAYDWMFRLYRPPNGSRRASCWPSTSRPEAVGRRARICVSLWPKRSRLISAAQPKAVAVDLILADST